MKATHKSAMYFALFPNFQKPLAIEMAKEIRDFLLSRGAYVVTEDEKSEAIGVPPLSSLQPSQLDFLVSLGGDGTILRVIHRYPDLSAPIVGINLGNLGFMADIPIQEIYLALNDLLEGRYTIQKRIVMEGSTSEGKNCFAINEIVIHRAQNPCLIDLSIHLNGVYLNTFSADGLIISTPNGSTAYSLAAGGPILTPDLSALTITPICPHTVSNRPVVINSQSEIKVEYLSDYAPVEITYDGFPFHHMANGQSVSMRISPKTFNLVAFGRHDFFSTLRTKLGWSGKLKN